MIKTTILKKWSNSLGIRIGKKEALEKGFQEGDQIKVLIRHSK